VSISDTATAAFGLGVADQMSNAVDLLSAAVLDREVGPDYHGEMTLEELRRHVAHVMVLPAEEDKEKR
jgi:hypothetical protein